MADAANSLLEVGFSKVDVVKLIKRCPVILGVTPTSLKGCAYFLKQYCGLQKVMVPLYLRITRFDQCFALFLISFNLLQVELLPFVMKNPNILCMDITDLRQKVDYLFKSLGGSPAILRQFPSYLAYDLNSLIRPRAEFARAIEVDPLQYGLSFLLRSKTKDFAKSLEVEEKTFEKFRKIFVQKYKENDLDIINVKKKFKDTVYWEKLMRNQYGAASAEAIDRGNGTVVPSPIRTTLY